MRRLHQEDDNKTREIEEEKSLTLLIKKNMLYKLRIYMLLNFYPPSFFTKLKFSFFSNFFSYKLLDAIRNFGISKNKKKKRTLLAEQLLSLTSFSRNERRFSRVFTSFPFTFEKKDITGRKA